MGRHPQLGADAKRYPCPVLGCRKIFPSKGRLHKHWKNFYHGERGPRYLKCTGCPDFLIPVAQDPAPAINHSCCPLHPVDERIWLNYVNCVASLEEEDFSSPESGIQFEVLAQNPLSPVGLLVQRKSLLCSEGAPSVAWKQASANDLCCLCGSRFSSMLGFRYHCKNAVHSLSQLLSQESDKDAGEVLVVSFTLFLEKEQSEDFVSLRILSDAPLPTGKRVPDSWPIDFQLLRSKVRNSPTEESAFGAPDGGQGAAVEAEGKFGFFGKGNRLLRCGWLTPDSLVIGVVRTQAPIQLDCQDSSAEASSLVVVDSGTAAVRGSLLLPESLALLTFDCCRSFAVCSFCGGKVAIFEVPESGAFMATECLQLPAAAACNVISLAWSSQSLIAGGCFDGSLVVWDAAAASVISVFSNLHFSPVTNVSWNSLLAVASSSTDGTLVVLPDATRSKQQQPATLISTSTPIVGCFLKREKVFYSDLRSGLKCHLLNEASTLKFLNPVPKLPVTAVSLLTDEHPIALGTVGGQVYVVKAHKKKSRLIRSQYLYSSCCCRGGGIAWNRGTGEDSSCSPDGITGVSFLSLSPDGAKLCAIYLGGFFIISEMR